MFSSCRAGSASANLQAGCFSLRLGSVHSVKGLVEEKADCKGPVHPGRHVLVHCRIVPQHGQEVDDDEAEAGEGDL